MDPSREICRGHQRALSPWSKRERERERERERSNHKKTPAMSTNKQTNLFKACPLVFLLSAASSASTILVSWSVWLV